MPKKKDRVALMVEITPKIDRELRKECKWRHCTMRSAVEESLRFWLEQGWQEREYAKRGGAKA
jgi:hypothetical protein